ncbi:rhomboid family intramembrane serine protease [Pseudidiomarina homiensis]|uniref:Peptidase S54 rhomboid domain-containing protein n=1 Tax=Pseudidiomarina homiensis TaxID=364198 RepID=A0A432Y3S4_9GAMM|nr:rhomboid family intramembrane serine protease [Pseudidiomarina homiensis]RUO55620.1 hypothetical protein CWI70_02200 [Pseudidiomarina homiensis]
MSDRIQVLICSLLLVVTSAWAYYFQFEYPSLLAEFDFAAQQVWQEPWRLLTAHFLHLTELHWLLNALAFFFITILFARYFNVRTFLNALIIIAIGSSLTLTITGFEQHFVGLSIVNHGLLTIGLLLELHASQSSNQRKLMFAAVIILIAKWFAEFIGVWQSFLAAGQVQQIWLLHGLGILFGILAWWLHNRRLAKLAQLGSD